jgi:hypothetical protein
MFSDDRGAHCISRRFDPAYIQQGKEAAQDS